MFKSTYDITLPKIAEYKTRYKSSEELLFVKNRAYFWSEISLEECSSMYRSHTMVKVAGDEIIYEIIIIYDGINLHNGVNKN